MKTTDTLPGFNYEPFTKDDLTQSMLERKESGECPVSDPNFYKPWDMVEVGTEEYERELQKYDQVRKDRLEKKKNDERKVISSFFYIYCYERFN